MALKRRDDAIGGDRTSTAAVDDAINPATVDFLRAQFEAESFAHHPGEEAADRMLLPARGLHDGGDRHPLGLSQETENLFLLRASSGLRLKLFLSGSFSGQPFAAVR
jgi:hypothetical protein